MTDNINDNKNIVPFINRVKEIKQQTNTEEVNESDDIFMDGLEAFKQTLNEDTTGFITITFDEDTNPSIVYTGDLDLLKTIGTLEFTKSELMQRAYYSQDLFSDTSE